MRKNERPSNSTKAVGGRLRMLPVALEDHRPAGDDLADLADRHLLQRQRVDDPRIDREDRDAEALQLGALRRVRMAGRGGLGEAVAFGEADAELVEQALRHRMRHRRAAAAHRAQAGEVEALVVGAAEQVDHHRRNADPVRDPVVRDQPPGELAVPARHQHHRGAGIDRAEHAVEHAGDVEHRHHAEAQRLGRAVAPLAADACSPSGCDGCACSPWAGRSCPRCRAGAPGRRAPAVCGPGAQLGGERVGPADVAGRQLDVASAARPPSPATARRPRRSGLRAWCR